jgi:lipoprotein-releasing system permease protein
MQVEKWAIYGILTMMLVIAAFNLIGALTMLVLEKQQDMQILKAMGARSALIQKIFLTEGVLLALIGGISGTLLALFFCYLQVQCKLIPLEGSFVIDYYPVEVKPIDIVLVFSTVFLVAVAAAWVPSRKAARQRLSLKGQ